MLLPLLLTLPSLGASMPALTVASASAAAMPAILIPPTSATKQNVQPIAPFNVTGFAASAVILSHRVFYRFNVTVSSSLPPIECSLLGTTLSSSLSTTPLTRCGGGGTETPPPAAELQVAFQWTHQADDGTSNLMIMRTLVEDAKMVTEEANYTVPAEDTPSVGEGMFRHMVYEGPENFSVPAFRYEI